MGTYGDRWIEYSFDQVYALDTADIWNYNEIAGDPTPTDPLAWWNWCAMGVKDVYIQISTTGGSNPSEWTTVAETFFNIDPCNPATPATTTIDFGGIEARYVVITLKNGNEGTYINNLGLSNADFGLSEIRFYGDAVPTPAIGNPTAANGWDTTSAVSVTSSDGAGASGREWINTINGAGLDAATGTLHGITNWGEMGVGPGTPNPRGGTVYEPGDPNGYGERWVEYSFDQVYALDSMEVWAYNENGDWYWSAMSVKDVLIEVSTTGGTNSSEWTTAMETYLNATPADPTPSSTVRYFGGEFGSVSAKYVVLSLKNGNEGTYINNLGLDNTDFGLSEVRFFGRPVAGLNACGDEGTVYLDTDLNTDCYVNLLDFSFLTDDWMHCTDPENSDCDPYWSWE